MSVRRDVYQELGGFKAGFGNTKAQKARHVFRLQPRVGDEEAEFCIRGLQRWPARHWLHEPRVRVRHRVPPERTRFGYFLSQCYEEGLGAAIIARSLGRQDGLSMERAYATKILPRGIARGLAEAVVRRDVSGLCRSAAIVAGFGATLSGYVLGRALLPVAGAARSVFHAGGSGPAMAHATFPPLQVSGDGDEPWPAGFQPIRIVEVEIGRPLPAVPGYDSVSGRVYARGLAFIRLHARPLGIVEFSLAGGNLSAEGLADRIQARLGEAISQHLQGDGFASDATLTAAGLGLSGRPLCIEGRDRACAEAPLISVIIPTSNRSEQLATCLQSVIANVYPHFEVIVADNVPTTPDTADLVRRLALSCPQLRYVREDQPGSASARNRGLSLATGEIVAFTDDDVVVDRHWLAELAAAFNGASDVGCVTGLIMPRELETPAQVWFEQYGGFGKGFSRLVFDMWENRPDDPLFPFNAGMFGSGNNMAFKTAVLKELGGFDPRLGNNTPALGGVDVDAFFRTVIKGHRIVYEPAAIVYHAHRREYAGLKKQVFSFAAGTTAVQVKSLLQNPRLLPGFAQMLPAGLRFALSPNSALHAKKSGDYPKELTRLDRKGLLYGPVAYLRSCWWWNISLPRARH